VSSSDSEDGGSDYDDVLARLLAQSIINDATSTTTRAEMST